MFIDKSFEKETVTQFDPGEPTRVSPSESYDIHIQELKPPDSPPAGR
jgi:hypothetical protein